MSDPCFKICPTSVFYEAAKYRMGDVPSDQCVEIPMDLLGRLIQVAQDACNIVDMMNKLGSQRRITLEGRDEHFECDIRVDRPTGETGLSGKGEGCSVLQAISDATQAFDRAVALRIL